MKTLSSFLLLSCLSGIAVGVAADTQMCNDMYPADAYEAEERSELIQDCLAAYAPEPTYDDSASEPAYQDNASEPAYYEGTVEDFVNDVPTEENPPE